jgi:hypothetical protein
MKADRLLLLKNYYVPDIPTKEDLEEAKQICIKENCIIELRWCPNIYAGWYHEYVFEDSDPAELDAKTPKVYGI